MRNAVFVPRDRAVQYLEARGQTATLERRLVPSAGTSRAPTKRCSYAVFGCGCLVPIGYPLWRKLAPCDEHRKALQA